MVHKIKRTIILAVLLVIGLSNSFAQTSYLVADGVAVFYPSDFDSSQTLPSLVFQQDLKYVKDVPADWEIKPDYSSKKGKSIVKINYKGKVDLYGTGEVTGPLKRNKTKIELWNTDNYAYEKADGKRLYQSHPWILGVRKDGTSFGIIADNTWKQTIDLHKPIKIVSEGPSFRVIIIEKESPQEVIKTLAALTGTIEMPPLWALGYQQCRYSYYPDSRVKEIASGFRERNIPCDVIWMDIDYMQNFKIFTFDSTGFSNPASVNDYLHSIDFHSVWMIDPGVKKEENYFVYDQGTAGNHWVLDNANNISTGDVWPGECVFPDFTRPETRAWWGALYKDFLQTGIDGVWNDMNEPAVFNGPGGTMPEDNVHRGGGILPAGPHLRYHNVYGLLMVKASRAGITKVNPHKRPFVLSRANFLGGQKYAATWTGDNISSWDHFKMATPMVLNLGLSGQPFTGPDLGGFKGSPDGELFANWMALGAFYPFCRGHSEKGTNDQEPWSFGQKVEDVSRTALERRYRLLPYLYTLFWEAAETGLPIMRPVFFADITDTSLRSEDEAFMWGDDLLIVPKWAPKPELPQGVWKTISLVGEDSKADEYQPELKQKGGSIIPLGSVIQSTADFKTDSVTVLVCLDGTNKATGNMYVDDGEGYDYQNGDYEVVTFSAAKAGNTVNVECSTKGKSQIDAQRVYKIGLVTDNGIIYSDWQQSDNMSMSVN